MERFDVTYYLTPTRFTAESGVLLARALLNHAPKSPAPRIQRALNWIERASNALTAACSARKFTRPRDARRQAADLGRAWVALREILDAKARLTGTDEAERAMVLRAQLLPRGTRFTRSIHEELWTVSRLQLERIHQRGHGAEIEALVGPALLPHLEACHRAFSDAMGLGDGPPRERPRRGAVKAAKAELAQAMAEYGRLLVGALDYGDEASVRRFRRAVRPLDRHRARNSA